MPSGPGKRIGALTAPPTLISKQNLTRTNCDNGRTDRGPSRSMLSSWASKMERFTYTRPTASRSPYLLIECQSQISSTSSERRACHSSRRNVAKPKATMTEERPKDKSRHSLQDVPGQRYSNPMALDTIGSTFSCPLAAPLKYAKDMPRPLNGIR